MNIWRKKIRMDQHFCNNENEWEDSKCVREKERKRVRYVKTSAKSYGKHFTIITNKQLCTRKILKAHHVRTFKGEKSQSKIENFSVFVRASSRHTHTRTPSENIMNSDIQHPIEIHTAYFAATWWFACSNFVAQYESSKVCRNHTFIM